MGPLSIIDRVRVSHTSIESCESFARLNSEQWALNWNKEEEKEGGKEAMRVIKIEPNRSIQMHVKSTARLIAIDILAEPMTVDNQFELS